MKSLKSRLFLFCLFIAGSALLCNIARADSGTYQISGGFTTFSGNVDGNQAPTYIRSLPIPPPTVDCTVVDCSNPLLFFEEVCPDAGGCATAFGPATNFSLLTGGDPANTVTFEAFGCNPSIPICSNTPNELDFVPSSLSILGKNIFGYDEMLLGSLMFTNGVWTGDADFGITITATDISTPHNAYTFDGLFHMTLRTPDPGVTDPSLVTHEGADCISLTTPTGQPVTNPVTHIGIGSVCVPELNNPLGLSNTTTFNLYGTIGSLDPTRFDDLSGGGFFLAPPGGNGVPEPPSLALVVSSIIGAALIVRRRRPSVIWRKVRTAGVGSGRAAHAFLDHLLRQTGTARWMHGTPNGSTRSVRPIS